MQETLAILVELPKKEKKPHKYRKGLIWEEMWKGKSKRIKRGNGVNIIKIYYIHL